MLTAAQRAQIYENKIAARRKRLNSFNIISFDSVPEFILNSFFGKNNYSNRFYDSVFCFLNNISYVDALKLIHWKINKLTKTDLEKMKKLMEVDFKKKLSKTILFVLC